ncbi:MAG: TIGR04086 family membrane protein [Lachnospiraceae bacterium]|nr:TIGR04086 family membrane protein [Lachnospiraceae bacterium]
MGTKIVEMGKALLISYLLTGIILAILSYFVFQYEMKEGIVNVIIVATYVIANFMGGFICGKKLKEKKFLWGLGLGILYGTILMIVSVALGNGGALADKSNLTMIMLCTGGGMLGGMLA